MEELLFVTELVQKKNKKKNVYMARWAILELNPKIERL